MKTPRTSRISALATMVVAVSLLGAGAAQGIPLRTLVTQGGTITQGDKLFSNFTFTAATVPANPNNPPTDLTANWGNVLDVLGATIDGNFGLTFTNTNINRWSRQNGGKAVAIIGFDVTATDLDFLIVDNHLGLTGVTYNPPNPSSGADWTGSIGSIVIDEIVKDLALNQIGTKNVTFDKDNQGLPLTDEAVFGPQRTVRVEKTITITAGPRCTTAVCGDIGLARDNSIRLDGFYQTFSQKIPEPATLAILGLGLAGLGLQRRRLAAK